MILFHRILKSAIQAAGVTALWYGMDYLFSPAELWNYKQAYWALFTGALISGAWTKSEAIKEIQVLRKLVAS